MGADGQVGGAKLNLCSGTWGTPAAHDGVVFDGKDCPCCAVLQEIEEVKQELKQAEKERGEFEAEAARLEAVIEEYRTDLRAMAREAQQAQEDVAKESIE